MRNLSKFQIIILGVFLVGAVGGVLVFGLVRSGSNSQKVELTVWGTMANTVFSEAMKNSRLSDNELFKVDYVRKDSSSFDIELLEALASGTGPDLFFIDSDSSLRHQKRAFQVSFEAYSEKNYKSSFIEGAENFLVNGTIVAFPLLVDPMVMYWNRDIFTNAGLLKPPEFWDEFYDTASLLSVREGAVNLTQSGVALGEYLNISNAYELLSTLIMQAGNPIVVRSGNSIRAVISDEMGLPVPPAESALRFYTDFSNPLKPFYSWNRSLPFSLEQFIAGDLGVYFGPASELFEINDRNPNLNFDVSVIPQVREGNRRLTYAKVEAIAISRNSENIAGAFNLALILSGDQFVSALSKVRSLPPARRSLLASKPGRAYLEIFYESAIIGKNWLSPDKTSADRIFRDMVESVTGGRSRPREAVSRARQELSVLLDDIQ